MVMDSKVQTTGVCRNAGHAHMYLANYIQNPESKFLKIDFFILFYKKEPIN